MTPDPSRREWQRGLDPAILAFVVGLAPIIVVHLAYVVSIAEGFVPACVPFWDGCTSISRAARHGWANHLFKAGMLPLAGGALIYWLLIGHWLRMLRPADAWSRMAVVWLGVVATLFLVLYATFLGIEGETYQWLRRYGITVYFSFTVLAEMLLTRLLLPIGALPLYLRRSLLGLCAAMLALGLASLPLQHLMRDRDAAVNAIEWCYTLLMTSVFPLIGLAWRQTGFRLQLVMRCGR